MPIWITVNGAARGTYLHTGIGFAGSSILGGALPLEHGINFSDALCGDNAFNATSTLLYAEYTAANTATLPIGWFADMLLPTFAGGFLRSKGFKVDGAGTVQVGTGLLTAISGGIALDAAGSLGTGTPAIAAGGSGYLVNDRFRDAYARRVSGDQPGRRCGHCNQRTDPACGSRRCARQSSDHDRVRVVRWQRLHADHDMGSREQGYRSTPPASISASTALHRLPSRQ